VQFASTPAPAPQQPQAAPEQPRKTEHKPQNARAQHRPAPAPKPQAEHQSDAQQLPAFLLRPVPLPKSEKPAAPPRKKVPVTA
jgi:hypothetical protein